MSVARHTVYNAVGGLVPVAVSLVTIPIYLRVVGLDRYGILAICWLLLGYFNLFDFGLGRATAQRIAALGGAGPEERSRVFWAAFLLSSALAAVAVLVFMPFAAIALKQVRLSSPEIPAELRRALPILAAALPLAIMNSVLAGAMQGRRGFLVINLAASGTTIGISVLPLLAALAFGPTLPVLIAASLVGRIPGILLLGFAVRRAVPVQAFQRPAPGEVGALLRFGGWTTVSGLIAPLLAFWDRFAIGALIGSAAVALYVVPFSVMTQLLVVPTSLSSALFPKLAEGTAEEAKRLTVESVRLLAFFLTPFTHAVLIVSGPFLYLWLGAEVSATSAGVAAMLLVGFWANSFAWIGAAQMQALAKPRITALIHMAELIPYILLLYVSLRAFGVLGAAFAWSVRSAADAIALFVCAGAPRRLFAALAVDAALLVLAAAAALSLPTWSPLKFAILGLFFLVSAAISWRRMPPRVAAEAALLKQRLHARRLRSRS